ncbi:uncharacterized protein LOC128726015 [Anopheles nili]|uniref:uncharacterized protein LOC128726015 n=1 Tax=Anopheles nili TaxID=185578 RepID=UPI00237B4CC7|nr:uncharacterized protein LOC128726015 [Anopheles nili]
MFAKSALLLVLCCTLLAGNVLSKMYVLINKVEVLNNPKVANASAVIRRFGSPMDYVADFQLQVLETVFDLRVSTIYYVPSLTGNYDKAFYNRTISFCTYLRQPSTDRILKMIYEDVNRRGCLPKRCPIQVGTYSFNKSFHGFRLPGFLPESKFRFDLNFYRGPQYEVCFLTQWYGELKRSFT